MFFVLTFLSLSLEYYHSYENLFEHVVRVLIRTRYGIAGARQRRLTPEIINVNIIFVDTDRGAVLVVKTNRTQNTGEHNGNRRRVFSAK